MKTFNAVSSAIFDLLFAPFAGSLAWVSVVVWSLLFGVVALVVYKYVSNQKGIEKAKNDIKVHLLEIRLFKEDILGVVSSTLKILWKNSIYIAHNLLPMVVMIVPFLAIMTQLVSHYAFDPIEPGSVQVLQVKVDREAAPDLALADVSLVLPAGVSLDAPPVRMGGTGEIAWRLRVEQPGDHELAIHLGERVETKGLYAGGEPRKMPVMRTKSWEGFLYPGEAGLDSDSPMYSAKLSYPERELPVIPSGEFGILLTVLVVSLAAGFALKGVFGVTL